MSDNRVKGRIIKSNSGSFEIATDDGTRLSARARGLFRHEGQTPTAGDMVLVRTDGNSPYIDEILPRKNILIRPPLANLDILFVTAAAAHPTPILTTIDKMTAIAEHNKIEPVIIVTKKDLSSEYAREIVDIYSSCGYDCFSVSSVTGAGRDEILDYVNRKLKGKTAALAGASGIGKSTLLNLLFPSLSLTTGALSERISRGKNTTRCIELYSLCGGYFADTPGFSLLDFSRFNFMGLSDLVYSFREYQPYIGKCRYTNCTHTKESECEIVKAVAEGKLSVSRHESYKELYNILKEKKEWQE